MLFELDQVSAEIDEATRLLGDGSEAQAADHLAAAAALLDVLVAKASGPIKPGASEGQPLRRPAAA